jgi:uncharacterized membrane protein
MIGTFLLSPNQKSLSRFTFLFLLFRVFLLFVCFHWFGGGSWGVFVLVLVLDFESRALCMLSMCSAPELHFQPYQAVLIIEAMFKT